VGQWVGLDLDPQFTVGIPLLVVALVVGLLARKGWRACLVLAGFSLLFTLSLAGIWLLEDLFRNPGERYSAEGWYWIFLHLARVVAVVSIPVLMVWVLTRPWPGGMPAMVTRAVLLAVWLTFLLGLQLSLAIAGGLLLTWVVFRVMFGSRRGG
jgi:hypothetical protein